MTFEEFIENIPEEDKDYFRKAMQGVNLSGWRWQEEEAEEDLPKLEDGIHCGTPTYVDEEAARRFDSLGLLPNRRSIADAIGDSMIGAGIEDGDELYVKHTNVVRNFDIVVANLDGEVVVKSYLEDEYGEKWLISQNPEYEPVRMSDYNAPFIIGRVVQVKKHNPRGNEREVMKMLKDAQKRCTMVPTKPIIAKALRAVQNDITNKRLWFSIYRVLVDKHVLIENDYSGFVDLLDEIMGEEAPCIDPKEISRMNVQTFSKPLDLWDIDDAPVQKQQARKYQMLAKKFTKALP